MSANILVVDDSVSYVKILQLILESEHHNVLTCYDGRQIFDILEENRIDVILLDIVMPYIDGFHILGTLQKHDRWKHIPVLMVTGLANPEDVKQGLDMGAMDYIKKPCEKIEILARVHAALRLKEKHDLLREYANMDELTQLYNKSYINKTLRRMEENRQSFKRGIAFDMIDADFFKKVNDTYGHLAGDEVLAGIAAVIRRTVKNIDTVGRFGGEEFCVIFPNTLLEEACLAAERIRKNIESARFRYGEKEITITVSQGVSYISPKSNLTIADLKNAADEALYRAKNNGRNRVES